MCMPQCATGYLACQCTHLPSLIASKQATIVELQALEAPDGYVRLGLAWLGLAWLGLAWLGLAWLGLAWLGLAWLGLARPQAKLWCYGCWPKAGTQGIKLVTIKICPPATKYIWGDHVWDYQRHTAHSCSPGPNNTIYGTHPNE
jgi:hypothetical protein